jgi:hypothetical protein
MMSLQAHCSVAGRYAFLRYFYPTYLTQFPCIPVVDHTNNLHSESQLVLAALCTTFAGLENGEYGHGDQLR